MKYAYVVTRINDRQTPGIRDIPNLGVHSNLKAATRHYRAVCEDRGMTFERYYRFDKFGVYAQWDRFQLLANTYFPEHAEEIRLERWRLGVRK